ncbi:HPP family protein [Klebsiella pneumoniae]|nr:HPP family protein [Klebsiella pneumoniae]
MGASAYSCLAYRAASLAQPWSIVGGNVLSALIGVTVGSVGPRCGAGLRVWRWRLWPSPDVLRCPHPPAAWWP